jgi:hypothetical protein
MEVLFTMFEQSDTNPAAEAFLLDGYRKMDPGTKLLLAMEMSRTVMELAQTGILRRYPGISDIELGKRLGALVLGRELSIKVNGWDPEKEGY